MANEKHDTIKDGSVELKEDDLDQAQAGAARRTATSAQADPAPRSQGRSLKFDLALVAP